MCFSMFPPDAMPVSQVAVPPAETEHPVSEPDADRQTCSMHSPKLSPVLVGVLSDGYCSRRCWFDCSDRYAAQCHHHAEPRGWCAFCLQSGAPLATVQSSLRANTHCPFIALPHSLSVVQKKSQSTHTTESSRTDTRLHIGSGNIRNSLHYCNRFIHIFVFAAFALSAAANYRHYCLRFAHSSAIERYFHWRCIGSDVAACRWLVSGHAQQYCLIDQ